jgi:outer membrane lipase/esterase
MGKFSKLASSLILALVAVTTSAVAAPYTSLVIFGDSLSDSGNNSNAVGASPGQVVTGNGYIPTFTYGAAPFGTYSNGPVWATQFAAAMGLSALPSVIPAGTPVGGGLLYPGGTNYAFGGATTTGGQVPSLTMQAGMYLSSLSAGSDVSNTLFVVAGGGNNARNTFASLATQPSFGTIGNASGIAAAQYANDIGNIVDNLQSVGAQHIIVWNTPDIGKAPAIGQIPFTASGLTGSQLGSLVSGTLNGALSTRLADEAGVQIFDLYALVGQAAASGLFDNTSDACGATLAPASCANINRALFWDGIHPTAAGHAYIAGQMLALAAPVPEPQTYAMLLVGLFVIGNMVRRRSGHR